MHSHADDMAGLDDYDRMLAADMEYERPLYAGPARTLHSLGNLGNLAPVAI
jgi:hypothetical protein